MGIYASFQFFGAFLGGVLSGVITEYFSPEAVFAASAIICVLWFFLFAGFKSMDHLKRYALVFSADEKDAEELQRQFADLPGIADFNINVEEATVYLKVDSQVFDLQAAQELVH